MNCHYCNRPTDNPKYCSMRCSGKVNAKNMPKKHLQGICVVCNSPCRSNRQKCPSCIKIRSFGECTIKELSGRSKSKADAIRMKCRKDMLKLNLTLACYLCGYDKHINFCHIKPVKSFPDTATVNEINSPDNLTILCPNHHWELDHNMLDVYVPTITEMTRKGFEPLSPT